MEEHLNPLALSHVLQYTLRSLCSHHSSQWHYAVFWRILPRNYPPPKWDAQGAYDRSRGNKRNWILVWEDGFCNFHQLQEGEGLQPEIFFKMSHEIYNYGEGLIGKVAADSSHKWIHKDPNENQEIDLLSAWHNSAGTQPRTWEAQFQSGVKSIALIAVKEGVVQLGATHKVVEDSNYVVLLRNKFSHIESIPGVLLPHPSSTTIPTPAPSRPMQMGPPMEAQLQPMIMSHHAAAGFLGPLTSPMEVDAEREYEYYQHHELEVGGEMECSNSTYLQYFPYQHHDLNLAAASWQSGF